MRKCIPPICNIYFSIFCITIFSQCTTKLSPRELKDRFNKNKTDLEFVIKSIEADKELESIFWYEAATIGKLPVENNRYSEIFKKLKQVGIKHLSVHPNSYPRGTRWYYLETSWPNDYLICLNYNQYDSAETKRDYYSKDDVDNETWGLADNWFMFRWVKDKPYKQ